MPTKKPRALPALSINPRLLMLVGGAILVLVSTIFFFTRGSSAPREVDPCEAFTLVGVSMEECRTATPRFYRFDFVPANNVVPGDVATSGETTVPANIEAIVRLDAENGSEIRARVFDREIEEWSDWLGERHIFRIRAGDRVQLSMRTPRRSEATANGRITTVRGRQVVSIWPARTGRAEESERLVFTNVNLQEPDFEVVSEPVEVTFTRSLAIAALASHPDSSMRILDADRNPKSDWLIPRQEVTVEPGDFVELRTLTPSTFGNTNIVQIQRIEDGRTIGEWKVSFADEFVWRPGNWTGCPTPVLSQWGEWSQCTAICDGGTQERRRSCQAPQNATQSRSVECVDANGARVDDAECRGERPETEQACQVACRDAVREERACNEQACSGFSWVAGEWSACTGARLTGWSPWSTCSTECGQGTQTRDRICEGGGSRTRTVRCTNAAGETVAPTLCQEAMPERRESCDECSGDLNQTRNCNRSCPGEGGGDAFGGGDDPFASTGGTGGGGGNGGGTVRGGATAPAPGDDDDRDEDPSTTPPTTTPTTPPTQARIMPATNLCLLAGTELTINVASGSLVLDATGCTMHAGQTLRIVGAGSATLEDACAGVSLTRDPRFSLSLATDPVCQPIADPYAGAVPAFDPFTLTSRPGSVNVSTDVDPQAFSLEPGIYTSEVSFQGRYEVTLAPGTYVFQGGFRMDGTSAVLRGTGVTIYLDNNSSFIVAAATSTIDLSAPTSGRYEELVIVNRGTGSLSFNTTGPGSRLSGLVYAPRAMVTHNIAGSVTNYTTRIFGANVMINANNANWTLRRSQGSVSQP